MNALEKEYARFESSSTRGNPGYLWEVSDLSRFLRHLSAEEKLGDFSQGDWIEFGRDKGLNDDQIGSMLEGTATWIVDEKVPVSEQEPADWPEDTSKLKGSPGVLSPSRPRGNPQKKGFHSGPTARRGTPAFEELMEEMLEEWELEEDLADNTVELRRYEDTFEYRLKGHSTWELLEDDDEDGADEDDGEEE